MLTSLVDGKNDTAHLSVWRPIVTARYTISIVSASDDLSENIPSRRRIVAASIGLNGIAHSGIAKTLITAFADMLASLAYTTEVIPPVVSLVTFGDLRDMQEAMPSLQMIADRVQQSPERCTLFVACLRPKLSPFHISDDGRLSFPASLAGNLAQQRTLVSPVEELLAGHVWELVDASLSIWQPTGKLRHRRYRSGFNQAKRELLLGDVFMGHHNILPELLRRVGIVVATDQSLPSEEELRRKYYTDEGPGLDICLNIRLLYPGSTTSSWTRVLGPSG